MLIVHVLAYFILRKKKEKKLHMIVHAVNPT